MPVLQSLRLPARVARFAPRGARPAWLDAGSAAVAGRRRTNCRSVRARRRCAIPSARSVTFARACSSRAPSCCRPSRSWSPASRGCRSSSTRPTASRPKLNRIAVLPVPPNRGLIKDRNGAIIARNYSAYTLEITPAKVENLEQTIDELAKVVDIQPRDRRRFKKLLEDTKRFDSVPDPHAPVRRGRRALHGQPFPVPGRRAARPPVPRLPARRHRVAHDRLHRAHFAARHRARREARRSARRSERSTTGPSTSARSASSRATSCELHGTPGVEEVEITAGGRAVRTLSRKPSYAGQEPGPVGRHRAAEDRRARVRRSARAR